MANSFFQFKQFTIHQDHCAMKVCTDACLFGAWVAARYSNIPTQHILDIGTGTGLLSCMLAQKTNAIIDAVELDAAAAQQASVNVAATLWKDRIHIHQQPIQDFQSQHAYSLIISNPPFFENDLKSADTKRNTALHSTTLLLEELFAVTSKLLMADGQFAVLLPYHRNEEARDLAKLSGLHIHASVAIHQTEKHSAFRSIFLLQKQVCTEERLQIIIKENNCYTPLFKTLLKDYYLQF